MADCRLLSLEEKKLQLYLVQREFGFFGKVSIHPLLWAEIRLSLQPENLFREKERIRRPQGNGALWLRMITFPYVISSTTAFKFHCMIKVSSVFLSFNFMAYQAKKKKQNMTIPQKYQRGLLNDFNAGIIFCYDAVLQFSQVNKPWGFGF